MIEIFVKESMDELDAMINCNPCGSAKDVQKIEMSRGNGATTSFYLCEDCRKILVDKWN